MISSLTAAHTESFSTSHLFDTSPQITGSVPSPRSPCLSLCPAPRFANFSQQLRSHWGRKVSRCNSRYRLMCWIFPRNLGLKQTLCYELCPKEDCWQTFKGIVHFLVVSEIFVYSVFFSLAQTMLVYAFVRDEGFSSYLENFLTICQCYEGCKDIQGFVV